MTHLEPAHPIFEYNQIDDHVFIGTNACCAMHFEQELLAKGVTADISLEGERVDQPYGVETYLWLPTADHEPPTRAQVDTGAATLDHLVSKDK